MWTHFQPHLKQELTSSSISKHARVSLYRAINLRRLIAMTGSGTTAVYGMPDWRQAAAWFLQATSSQLESLEPKPLHGGSETRSLSLFREKQANEVLQRIEPLVDQLNQICGSETEKCKITATREHILKLDDFTVIMDICEAILMQLPEDKATGMSRLLIARKLFAENFRHGEIKLVRRCLMDLFDISSDSIDKQKKLNKSSAQYNFKELDKPPESHVGRTLLERCLRLIISGDKEPKELIQELYTLAQNWDKHRSSSEFNGIGNSYGILLEEPNGTSTRDIVGTLLDDMRIGRVMTLNYDVEFERSILGRRSNNEDISKADFANICHVKSSDRPFAKRTTILSGVKKGAVSLSLDNHSIGEIISFSAFSRRYDHQILHLHGRLDDAENLVLTQRDYLRVYMRQNLPRAIFREAQEVLFGGNDVLLVGVGISESDVMRPFRRFVARGDYNKNDSRRVFLLKETNYCKCCKLDKHCLYCSNKNDQFAIQNMVDFNIHTIFYGGTRYRYLCSALSELEERIKKLINSRKTPLLETLEFDDKKSAVNSEKLSKIYELLEHEQKLSATHENAPALNISSLISEFELEAIKLLPNPPTEAVEPSKTIARYKAYHALLQELIKRVNSRAVCQELKTVKEESGIWWDAWRHPPYERRAIYYSVPENLCRKKNFLWMRHSLVTPLIAPTEKTFADWGAIKFLRKQAMGQNTSTSDANRKVLRVAMPVGFGKGTLIRLLMNSRIQHTIFSRTLEQTGSESHETHKAAFIAHLTFSMEFSSVTKALTRFVARQAARLQIETDYKRSDEVRNTLTAIKDDVEELLKTAFSGESWDNSRKIELYDLLKEVDFVVGEEGSTEDQLKPDQLNKVDPEQLAEKIYIARRENEPRLVARPDLIKQSDLERMPERPHRLDVLSSVLTEYSRIASPTQHRLFICLSGLDRICDHNGDGKNPMHRALFRMLTGIGDSPQSHCSPPMDVLLLAGRPQNPICYLSEELKLSDNINTEDEKRYYKGSATGRTLLKWPELPPFSWQERIDSVAQPCKSPLDAKLKEQADGAFKAWADIDFSGNGPRLKERFSTKDIHRALWGNMSLTVLTLICWRHCYAQFVNSENTHASSDGGNRCTKSEEAQDARNKNAAEEEFIQFIRQLDQSVARDLKSGCISGLLNAYARLDKKCGIDDNHWLIVPTPLYDLILQHLTLYSLPVEPLVLLGCPRIESWLLNNSKFNCTALETAHQRWVVNDKMIYHLEAALNVLTDRGLIIQIRGSANNNCTTTDTEPFLHQRYAIHGTLRVHFAHQMQFVIVQDGDLNHHQISLYCDQPRDLPTPSLHHFNLVRELMESQTNKWRKTLSTAYKISAARDIYRRTPWDPVPPNEHDTGESSDFLENAVTRIYAPNIVAASKSCGALGKIHAVSQRLRSSFSLIRGVFSVGSLSRLDGFNFASDDDSPFEIYHGWLSNLINAAVGLERNQRELERVLSGVYFPPNAGQFLSTNSDILTTGEKCEEKDFDAFAASLIEEVPLETAMELKDEQPRRPLKVEKYLKVFGIDPRNTNAASTEDKNRLLQNIRELYYVAQRMHSVVKKARDIGFNCRQTTEYHRLRHPYYRDEIAWLYNERALAMLIQGRVFDSIPLFRRSLAVMSHQTSPDYDNNAFHAAERRIRLNISIAQIERGNVSQARLTLEELERSLQNVKYSTPNKVKDFASGYVALCDHIGGSHERARKGYEKVLREFVKHRDLRAASIFNRHLGDLFHNLGSLKKAKHHIDLAVNSASQAEQRDVENLALSSLASLFVTREDYSAANGLIDRVLTYSQNMGLYRTEADILLVDSRLKLQRGEYSTAAESAAKVIALSSRYGLRLRKLSGLISYANIQFWRGELELCRGILEESKTEAERLGYQLQASRAADILARLR